MNKNPLPLKVGMHGRTKNDTIVTLVHVNNSGHPFQRCLWLADDNLTHWTSSEQLGNRLCYANYNPSIMPQHLDIVKWWEGVIEPTDKPELAIGQVWRHECGTYFIVAHLVRTYKSNSIDHVQLLSLTDGDWYCDDDIDPFDGYSDLFTYVGMANDVLKIEQQF